MARLGSRRVPSNLKFEAFRLARNADCVRLDQLKIRRLSFRILAAVLT